MRVPAAKDPPRYEPLDELLERPRVRILRAFLRIEWSTALDLYDAIDVAEHLRPAFGQTMLLLQRKGYLERRGIARRGVEYRITSSGRAELKRILETSNPEREGMFLWRGTWRHA